MNIINCIPIPHLPKSIVLDIKWENIEKQKERLRKEIEEKQCDEYKIVFVHFKNINFIPTEYIEIFLEQKRKLKENGSNMFFVELSDPMQELLQSVGIPKRECFKNLSEGIKACNIV